MGSRIFGGLTLKELALRAWREAYEDNAFSRAAELAYFYLLALFPMLIFLISVFSFLPGLQEALLDWLAKVMPHEARGLVADWVETVVSNRSGGLLSLGLLGSLWAASYGMGAAIDALNTAYDVEKGYPFWKTRLLAIELTIALSIFIVGGEVLIMFGDWLAMWWSEWIGLGATFTAVWRYFDYLIGLLLLTIGVDLIYYFAPNVKRKWRLITPGATFAVMSSLLASIFFSLYLRFAPSYSATYGSLGAVIVLMLWLYLLGLALFIGGEINSEIERAAGNSKPEAYHDRISGQKCGISESARIARIKSNTKPIRRKSLNR
jgi:membrane protein